MKTQDIKNIARAMQQVAEKLAGGQHKLDKDKDGDIDGKDFAMMRKKKNEKVTTAAGQEVDKPIKHDCATHVEHAEWGKGQPISGMHTIVETTEGEGYVTHYDVMFKHGIEKDVSVDNLRILVSEAHGHSINASKKKKMAEDEVEINPTMKTKKEKKGSEVSTQVDEAMQESAKAAATGFAKLHKNLKVSSFGNNHFVHHKDDEDGAEAVKFSHKGGQIHVSHDAGATGGGTKKAKSVADAISHAKKMTGIKEEVEQVNELDKKTLGSYIKKAGPDAVKQTAQAKRHADAGDMADKDRDMYKHYAKSQRATDKAKNRQKYIGKAVDKLTASYKTESKNAALMKKLAKASAPSEKGKKAVSLPKAPFEIPKKDLNLESSAYYTQTVAKHLAKKDGHDYSKLPVYHVGKPHQQGYTKKAKDALARGEYKRGLHDSTKKEGVEWAVYNKIKENRAAHYKSATAPEEMDSKASGNEKDFKAKHKVNMMPAELEKKGHDDASAAGRVTKKAPARNGDNAAGDKIQMAVDTTKG